MNRQIRVFAVLFCVLVICSCNKGRGDDIVVGPYTPAVSSPTKISVIDVSNDTQKVFDVDVIGLLWTGLEDSLKKRGMLWNGEARGAPYSIVAHVLEYRKGSAPGRLLPYYGDTVLSIRCELKSGDRQLAVIETKRKISYGQDMLTRGAWRNIFADVAEEVISQAIRKL